MHARVNDSRLTSENLVDEHFDVVACERLWRHDDFVQVALHQLRQYIAARNVVHCRLFFAPYLI